MHAYKAMVYHTRMVQNLTNKQNKFNNVFGACGDLSPVS